MREAMKRLFVLFVLSQVAGCAWTCGDVILSNCARTCGALGVKRVDLTKPECVCMTEPERRAAVEGQP